MASTPEAFIQEITQAAREHYIEYTHAMWEAATTGSEEANQREKEAQRQQMRFWADPDRFQRTLELDQAGSTDPVTARSLRVIRLSAAKAQQSESTIQRITELEAEIRQTYYNFRPEVAGKSLSDNELDEILLESDSTEQVRQAWLASKEVGQRVAADLRELVRARNLAAQEQGYRDHFARSLELNEIDEDELFHLFDQIQKLTQAPYQELMEMIRHRQADRFDITVQELQPWHFGDRFFQRAPSLSDDDFTEYFKGHDPVPLALAAFDAWGLEVRDILERSDLYAREGKNQHAFCLDLDRSGDVRTLNNLEPTHRWISTLLHELGHAVYDKNISPDLPWLLRKPPHTLSTEAIAVLTPRIMANPEWLRQHLGLTAAQADQAVESAHLRRQAGRLIFSRWVLVMTHFERAMYQNPDSDLNELWWDLKERFQGLSRPEGRHEPDWAAKYHLALAPVYYHNYLLGYLVSAQIESKLEQEIGVFSLNDRVGSFLRERVFAPGASLPWHEHVKVSTGRPLDPSHFTKILTGMVNE
ncbi:MAG: M2 family metallopeptidase [Anaerolineales bacterium]